jgi:hypothetical protein
MPHPLRKLRQSPRARPHLAPLRLKRPSAIAPNQPSRPGANIAASKSTFLGSYRPELSGLFRKLAGMAVDIRPETPRRAPQLKRMGTICDRGKERIRRPVLIHPFPEK